MAAPQITHLDDIESVDTDLVDAAWKPVRNHFGITSFGTNAYVARRASDVLIEDHSELRTGFEELYVVVRGEVEFTLRSSRAATRAFPSQRVRSCSFRRSAGALPAPTRTMRLCSPLVASRPRRLPSLGGRRRGF
jgi:hypothetical protein